MAQHTKSEVERRKLALLSAACRLMNPSFLHSGQPNDVANAVKFAVQTARALMSKIDETESP